MKKIQQVLKRFGPGIITGASDDDPSGIGTYTQAGALFGIRTLWTAPFSFPFMAAIQEISGRIGIVTGKGIASIIRIHYSKKILLTCVMLLFVANTINIAADIGAMAQSLQLVMGGNFWMFITAITAVTLFLQIHIPYKRYASILKYLTLSLLAYVAVAYITITDWKAILEAARTITIEPTRQYAAIIIAILGTTISPYLFFWQADEEREEEIAHKVLKVTRNEPPHITTRAIQAMRLDTIAGMFASNLIMFFIIAAAATTLHVNGITDIQTAKEAARALKPIAGPFAAILFSLGIVGTGLLAIPVLSASTGYAIAEAGGYKTGLYLKFKHAKVFYGIIIATTVIGALLNSLPIPPFTMLYVAATINGIVAVPIMIMMLAIANNKNIMGQYTSGILSNTLATTITIIMTTATIAMIVL
ncbi:MAG: hypothetical protein RIQ54_239 [Candidatus Parcubacteria bacterium]|jgi:Mn2+/Fe2+ NRAMP family transporter